MEKHIRHLRVYHFYKYNLLDSKSYPLGYALATNPQQAYHDLTGRDLQTDRKNELHTLWYNIG